MFKHASLRRCAAGILSLVLVLCLAVPSFAEGVYTPGVYEGTANGFGGEVTVTIEVSDSAIVSVEAKGDNETPGVGSNAIDLLPESILKAQSLAVDTVAGCTVSSEAVLAAAEAALRAVCVSGLFALPVWLALALARRCFGGAVGRPEALMLPVWALLAAALYALRYRPTQKRLAARLDALCGMDRVATAMEFSGDSGVLCRLQREDTADRLKKTDVRALPMRWPRAACWRRCLRRFRCCRRRRWSACGRSLRRRRRRRSRRARKLPRCAK